MGRCKNCYHQPPVLGCSQDVPSSTIIIWMSYIPISLSQLLASPSFSSHPHPLQSIKSPEQPLDCFTTLVQFIAYQTILALAYLHNEMRKITYQDIKPNNILLTPDGCVKLIDFGILCTESKVEHGPMTHSQWTDGASVSHLPNFSLHFVCCFLARLMTTMKSLMLKILSHLNHSLSHGTLS